MRNFYQNVVGVRLREVLDSMARRSPTERLSLAGEIDVARAAATSALEMFEEVCVENPRDEAGDPRYGVREQAVALAVLRQSMDHVRDMVTACARVGALADGVFSAEQVDYVVRQVGRAVDRVIAPADPGLAERFREEIDAIDVPAPDSSNDPERFARQIRASLAAIEATVPGFSGSARVAIPESRRIGDGGRGRNGRRNVRGGEAGDGEDLGGVDDEGGG